MLSRIGRWAAGRLQGGQGVQKYDGFMQRNPWARAGLDIAGAAALTAATGGAGALIGGKLGTGLALGGKWAGRLGGCGGGGGGAGGNAPGNAPLDQLGRTGMMELNDLRDGFKNFRGTDPMDGIDYNVPGGDLIDRATGSQWMQDDGFDSTIQNDALGEYRDGVFDETIANDATAGMGDRFGNAFTPGIEGPDAMGDMQGVYSQMMSASSGPGATAGVANADLSRLEGFDADAAFERYMTGANNRFMSSLQSGLNNLRDSAAGGNRLNTGFFDLDSGRLGRDLRQDFSNDISAAALQTNQQNLAARTSAAGLRTNMATTNASLATEASIANQRNRLDALVQASNNARLRADMQRGDRDFRADRFDRQTDDLMSLADVQRRDRNFRAERFDERGRRLLGVADRQRDDRKFAYGVGQDRLDRADSRTTKDRSNYLDAASARQRNWQAGVDARFKGSEIMDERFRDRRNTYLDWLSGMTDRAQGTQNARDNRNANRTNSWLQLGGQIAGAGMSYLAGRGGRRSASGGMMSPDAVDYVRRAKPVLTVGGR